MSAMTMRKWLMAGSCVALILVASSTTSSALQFWRKKEATSNNASPEKDAKGAVSEHQGGADLLVFNDVFDVLDPFYHTSLWDYHPASALLDPFSHHYHRTPRVRQALSDWLLDDYHLTFPSSNNKASAMMSSYNSLFHTDLVEKENEYRLQVDLPGIDTKDLSISVEENKRKGHSILTISAERKKEELIEQEVEKLPGQAKDAIEDGKKCDESKVDVCPSTTSSAEKTPESDGDKKPEEASKKLNKWIKQERLYGKMERQLLLPENVNIEAVKSQYVNGVLTVTLPKLPTHTAQSQKRQITIEAL